MKSILLLYSILFFSCLQADDKIVVEKKIDHYFQTWSDGDMVGYKNCFHENAVIQYKSRGSGSYQTESLENFVDGQASAIAHSEKMTEIPLSKKITIQDGTAHAIVRWKLTSGSRVSQGYDHFIWTKTNTGWKILYLYFYFD
jgi:ketosteroid isomerase-like protein